MAYSPDVSQGKESCALCRTNSVLSLTVAGRLTAMCQRHLRIIYICRVGRTARAGRGGMAITLATHSDYDVDIVKQIEATLIQSLWSLKPMKMKCCHYSEQ